MSPPPAHPKIFHITHVENLASIIADGEIYSDADMGANGKACTNIGMTEIKRRRLGRLVNCCPGTSVGDFVPFLFCPRSVMLFLLYRGNHPELPYRGGQTPIVHLVADMESVVTWSERERRAWAFSLGNASTGYAVFYNDLNDLDRLNWDAIEANNWKDATIKEGKQAEFLVEKSISWGLIEEIGTINQATADRVSGILENAQHKPAVAVRRAWYY